MDHSLLSPDYWLNLKLVKSYYIFKDKYGEPFLNIDLIDTVEKIENNKNVNEIKKNKIRKKDLKLLCENFSYRGNYIIGDNYQFIEQVDLLVPSQLVDEVNEFLKTHKKAYVSSTLVFYLCAITQFTYQLVTNSKVKDFDFAASLKAINNIQTARSIVIKGKLKYTIEDFSILNIAKNGIEVAFKNLDPWKHWIDYLNDDLIEESDRESKILQKIAYHIDLVLTAIKPKGSKYSRDLIIGHVLAWSNLDLVREGIEIRTSDTLRSWAGSLKSAYKRRNQSGIVKSKNEIDADSKKNVRELKFKSSFYEGLGELLKKYGIEHLETDITNLLYMIPPYTDQYPEINLEKEVIVKFDQILPYPKNGLNEGVRVHIESLLLEPIKQWPFDLMNHVIKFDLFLKAMKVASKLDRLQIISKSLLLADVFIDESIQADTAMMKVKFWLSQNRNINKQFPQKYSDR